MPTKKLKVHFIGIGGIGVSALARYYLEKGAEVSGSDLVSSEITNALKEKGAKIFIGPHDCSRLKLEQPGLVIYSPAIKEDNPELKWAKKKGIKCQSYPQALGELTKKYFTIAVCGSHGKSTVAAMIGLILTKAKLNPTVILGTKLKEFGDSNFRMGKSKYLVIEADEYKKSFLNYWPKIIVLTTLEPDHLDYIKISKIIFQLLKNSFPICQKMEF
jgi:UDP-N-acetylmuramate--alanine ligase